MAILEATIEKRFIEQLTTGESQWNYRPDLRTEDGLWANFKYILEQNNKARLNDIPLSDQEFEQVKNQVSFPSFYDAGRWLVGENGMVQVHVQRGNETLHLVVMNQEHIAGGTSCYEVINQYQALAEEGEDKLPERDRRFDVTLLINGLPMIHVELKNMEHSYMEGFYQIKKYIAEGKFRGIFSAVQMFIVSNAVNTKYFSAARDTELNPKLVFHWLDENNEPVPHYLDFAKKVLKIPMAHEMVSKYTVLDNDAKRLVLLRPYQIHAIESMRKASKHGQSGFIWHTTGAGKTITSYQATRNLLMDIPSIEKTIFLIDRKDLDDQTTMAFQSYSENDTVVVDDTNDVTDLIRKLSDGNRQMIVTTIQKMQIMIHRRLKETHPKYNKIKRLKIAFVVDECHRTITPGTKREFENFFAQSLWYGFTGTPRFAENAYPENGDLPRTTEQLYGKCLHKYTVKEAVHDNAVLGFLTEFCIDKDINEKEAEDNPEIYDNERHMLRVLNTILNESRGKLGFANGKGRTYEALLTVSSIRKAQEYYDLLKAVKEGRKPVTIDEETKRVLPDFPKFAITYSVSENEDGSTVNQDKMKQSLADYNAMFGTHCDISQIRTYNKNLNDRLARKKERYKSRDQQLDLVIVVDRLLTGFDAPCLSTLFIDRQPMNAHDIVQAFSRTNRLFDRNKQYGQVVTFQAPKTFQKAVNNALKLYSAGGTGDALVQDWDEVESGFIVAANDLRACAGMPEDVPDLSLREKRRFARLFQIFDKLYSQLKSFTCYDPEKDYGISDEEYEQYAAHYRNVIEELRLENLNRDGDAGNEMDDPLDMDYSLQAYSIIKIDYEYIVSLIQGIVDTMDEEENKEEFDKKIKEIDEYIDSLAKENDRLAKLMYSIRDELVKDREAFRGQNISVMLEEMRSHAINEMITAFVSKWHIDVNAVRYAVEFHQNGKVPNANALKESLDYAAYRAECEAHAEKPLAKFKCYVSMTNELEGLLKDEIMPLQER